MSPVSKRILMVRCGDPRPSVITAVGDYVQWFRNALHPDIEFVTVDPRRETPSPVWRQNIDAILFTGSPHGVYEPHPWLPALLDFVRETVLHTSTPTLGVCFGHQLISVACGGKVQPNPRGRELGTITVQRNHEPSQDNWLGLAGETFRAQAIHGDTVVRVPAHARVLAFSDRDACQAMEIGSAWTVQFHPEVTPTIQRAVLHAAREQYTAEGHDVNALESSLCDAPMGEHIFKLFCRRF